MFIHGQHLYWHLAQPVGVTDANRPHLKAINRGLALAVGGDPRCCDLARILRLPGFTNHKSPAAPVQLVESNSNLYTLEELAVFALEKQECSRPVTVGPFPTPTPELMARFHAVRRADKADKSGEITRAWRGEIGDGSSGSRYVLVGRLRRAGFSEDEVAAIVCSRRWYNRHSRRVKPPAAVRLDVERLLGKLA